MASLNFQKSQKWKFWKPIWWVPIAGKFVSVVGHWMRRTSAPDLEKVVFDLTGNEPRRLGSLEFAKREQDKRIRLETPTQKATPRDTVQQWKPKLTRPSWTEELVPFLANQLSDHTRRAYESDLKQFFYFVSRHVDLTDLTALTANHVILFRKAMEEGRLTGKPLAQSTINRKLAVIKSFMNWLSANKVLDENPARFVKGYPQSQESSLQGLSDEETRKILDKPNRNSRAGALHGAILYSLFFLGLRKGELIGLKVGDIDTERGVDVLKVRGKGHRVRILPLVPAVKERILHYQRVSGRDFTDKEAPLFAPTKNPRTGRLERALHPYAITYIVQKYAKKVGILKKISPHSCRATCISNALDRKATHRSVQHLAGWSTPLMIQRYDKRREDLKNSAAFLIEYPEVNEATA